MKHIFEYLFSKKSDLDKLKIPNHLWILNVLRVRPKSKDFEIYCEIMKYPYAAGENVNLKALNRVVELDHNLGGFRTYKEAVEFAKTEAMNLAGKYGFPGEDNKKGCLILGIYKHDENEPEPLDCDIMVGLDFEGKMFGFYNTF